MAQTHWLSSAATHCGAVRNMNEDAFLNRNNDGFWVVADGMGGHEAGEVASAMITAALDQVDLQHPISDVVDAIEDALLQVNHDIRNYSRTHCEGRTMGSTVVALVVRGSLGICLWAGDSRLYRFRGQKLERVSDDHSQVNEMLSRGLIAPQDAENHPASNVITRAVGAGDTLYVDMTLVHVEAGDVFLLCSDGLYGCLEEGEIARCVADGNVEAATHTLIELSLQAGARDNVTVIAVKVP